MENNEQSDMTNPLEDFRDAWWVHNLSQDLVVTRTDIVSKILAVIRAELPPQYKVNRDYAGVCKTVRTSSLV